MEPQDLAKSGTEHGHQSAFFLWLLRWNRSVHECTFAIPNGGSRGDNQRSAQIRGGNLKKEGVKRGVPDIMCAWPIKVDTSQGYLAGLFIEMKIASKGVTSDFQDNWHERLTRRGYVVTTCYNWQEAANATANYFGQAKPFQLASCGRKFSSKDQSNNTGSLSAG